MLLRFKECEDRESMWSSSGSFYISSAINRSVSVFKEPVSAKPKHTSLEERQQGEILVLCTLCENTVWTLLLKYFWPLCLPHRDHEQAPMENCAWCSSVIALPAFCNFPPFLHPLCAGEIAHSWSDISRKGWTFALWLLSIGCGGRWHSCGFERGGEHCHGKCSRPSRQFISC